MDSNPLVSHSQAVEFIENVDQERQRWVRLMYGLDVGDPANYDLTVNLKTLSLDSACATIAEAASQPRYQITDEVETELFAFAAKCRENLSRATGD
jgi:cytidylate kinase